MLHYASKATSFDKTGSGRNFQFTGMVIQYCVKSNGVPIVLYLFIGCQILLYPTYNMCEQTLYNYGQNRINRLFTVNHRCLHFKQNTL